MLIKIYETVKKREVVEGYVEDDDSTDSDDSTD